MRTFLLTFLGGLAALVVFFILIPLVLIMSFVPSGEPARVQNAVLQIDLRESPNDQPASEPLAAAFSGTSFVERSEERRVGKECATLCRSRWSPYH